MQHDSSTWLRLEDDYLAMWVKAVAVHKTFHEWIVVSLRRLGDKHFIDLRQFYGSAARKGTKGPRTPSRKGFRIPAHRMPALLKAMEAFYSRLQEENPDIFVAPNAPEESKNPLADEILHAETFAKNC